MGIVAKVSRQMSGKTPVMTDTPIIPYIVIGKIPTIDAAFCFPSNMTRVFLPCFLSASKSGNEFTNRTVVAIKQEWNSLTQYTSGIVPKGTPIKIGIVGPQGGGFYTGGSIQFLTESKSVVNQATRMISR